MKSHTFGEQAMLDATGRFTVHPSLFSRARIRGFGLGGAPEEIIKQEMVKFPDVKEVPELIARRRW